MWRFYFLCSGSYKSVIIFSVAMIKLSAICFTLYLKIYKYVPTFMFGFLTCKSSCFRS